MSTFTENLKERITLLEEQMASDAKILEAYRQILKKEEFNEAVSHLTPTSPVATIHLNSLPPFEGEITVTEAVAEALPEEEEIETLDSPDLSNEEFITAIIRAAKTRGVPPREINEASIAAGRITRGSNAVYSQLNTLKKKGIVENVDGLYYLTTSAKRAMKKDKVKRMAAGA